MNVGTIPPATVARLSLYLQCLVAIPEKETTVSSEALASMTNVSSAMVRKDLSYLGSHGVRGVGYDRAHLCVQIRRVLGLTRDWPVVIVGVGNLGSALANYGGFEDLGFRIVGLFDADPGKVGSAVGGHVVRPIEELESGIEGEEVSIAIITTPAGVAQDVADRLTTAGVRSILNFAPAVIHVEEGVDVRYVDLATELQTLTYYLSTS